MDDELGAPFGHGASMSGQSASVPHFRLLWDLLDHDERVAAIRVFAVAVLAALSSSVMVASIMPFLTVLADPAAIRETGYLADLYDRYDFTSPYDFLFALGLGSLIVIVFSIALQMLNIYLSSRFAMMRIHSLSRKLLAAYLGQPYEYFLNHNSGTMSTRVLSEAQEVVQRFILPTTEFLTSILTIIALVGLLLWVDPVVAIAAFGVLGGTYGGIFFFSRMQINRAGTVRARTNSERYRFAMESFGGIKEIKLLGRERNYVERYSAPAHEMSKALVRVQIISQTPYYTIQAVAFGGVILLCMLLISPIGLTGGNALATILPLLGVFAFAGQRMMPELGKMYQAITRIQATRAAIELLHTDLMEARDNPELPKQPPPRVHLGKELRFSGVTYRYPGADQAGVTDIDLSIRAGEKIGIVGGTGAGKTTFADLVLGLLAPNQGTISADGTAITRDNVRGWQQSVGYVPQDIFLSDASIAENIALGLPPEEVDLARVEEAARAAQIHAFIDEDLPERYDTHVGERGVRLSGGQRQRIGIARALYHDAELIVFDEATSALDNMTESEVMGAIDALPGDKTVMMIAHRLSTVERCDRIIVMERGRIVGCDSWSNLMRENLAFQRIAKLAQPA